jgi:hypothetical protein
MYVDKWHGCGKKEAAKNAIKQETTSMRRK